MQPDYSKAKGQILEIMAGELPKELAYHNLAHTTEYVLPAVEIFCRDMRIRPEEQVLVRTAALFHDSGFIKQYRENEPVGAALAVSILPSCGYSESDLKRITSLILATTMPQRPGNILEEILCDADLVSLGMPEFFETSMMLRRETETFVRPVSLLDWLEKQYAFLKQHRYFTPAARERFEQGKTRNGKELYQVLNRCKGTHDRRHRK